MEFKFKTALQAENLYICMYMQYPYMTCLFKGFLMCTASCHALRSSV